MKDILEKIYIAHTDDDSVRYGLGNKECLTLYDWRDKINYQNIPKTYKYVNRLLGFN